MPTEEYKRLNEETSGPIPLWKKWGAYVSERQWGTVREDYSSQGKAWGYLSHELARSKAYRWGEDGLAGFCDLYQLLVFSPAFWNGKDPILKERLFGLSPHEGNHGEDVKELYYYLDATPTHSYMRYLYKYPQSEFPYERLVQENQKRTALDPEFELIDTGIFDNHCYFDVFITYAKAGHDDICVEIKAFNRGNESAPLHMLPQLWFRNRWTWDGKPAAPFIKHDASERGFQCLYVNCAKMSLEFVPFEYHLPNLYLYGTSGASLLFTENETNNVKVWNEKNSTPFVKDAFHRHVIHAEDCVNPELRGTKAAFHYQFEIPPGESRSVFLRLTSKEMANPFADIEEVISLRKKEADLFYESIHSPGMNRDEKLIQRQAYAGLIWTQQFYCYRVNQWLKGDPAFPPPPSSRYHLRNRHWRHFYSSDIISMPDKWEYPWFASWDLAFQAVALGRVDMEFAKGQMRLLLSHAFQHPNGQIPAYEWSFSDLNPPVQAWGVWELYQMDKQTKGKGDIEFLESQFLKLVYNFGWWVNVVDRFGNNFFEGGFLGLDNISIIDRSEQLLGGGRIEQSDGTGWMAFFSLTLMRMALELARENCSYRVLATIFFEHFVYISAAMEETDSRLLRMWDEEDGFFYDIISYPNGDHQQLKVRSMVGLIPFFSIDFIFEDDLKHFPRFHDNFHMFLKQKKNLTDKCITEIVLDGKKGFLLSLMKPDQMKKILRYVWQQDEFRSPYGLRSLSKYHEKNPYFYSDICVNYEPGESTERIKGGNSNWRGPIWMPTSYLMLESLKKLNEIMGDDFIIEAPGEESTTLSNMISVYRKSLISIFLKDSNGRRPVHGDTCFYANHPHWKDLVLFYEHFHAETGRGLGASHQTGWSGLIASLIGED